MQLKSGLITCEPGEELIVRLVDDHLAMLHPLSIVAMLELMSPLDFVWMVAARNIHR